jgi:hypothetical protein
VVSVMSVVSVVNVVNVVNVVSVVSVVGAVGVVSVGVATVTTLAHVASVVCNIRPHANTHPAAAHAHALSVLRKSPASVLLTATWSVWVKASSPPVRFDLCHRLARRLRIHHALF